VHFLFIHHNFPAQFGGLAEYLVTHCGQRCTFLTARQAASSDIAVIRYRRKGGATRATHIVSRTFENYVWNSMAVYEALRENCALHSDAIVALAKRAGFDVFSNAMK
jgi:hypothetical protein